MASMHEVRPGLWLGSADTARDCAVLLARGVTHVLSVGARLPEYIGIDPCRYGLESSWPGKRARLHAVHGDPFERLLISVRDSPEEQLSRHFRASSAFITEALIHCRGGVLVHCFAGISRGATTVAQHLMRTEGLSVPQALSAIRSAGRTFIRPNAGFLSQLQMLETQLAGGLAEDTPAALAVAAAGSSGGSWGRPGYHVYPPGAVQASSLPWYTPCGANSMHVGLAIPQSVSLAAQDVQAASVMPTAASMYASQPFAYAMHGMHPGHSLRMPSRRRRRSRCDCCL